MEEAHLTAAVPAAIGLLVGIAVLAPSLARRVRAAGVVVAAGHAAVLWLLGPALVGALRGEPSGFTHPVVPDLGLRLSFELDGLAAVFVMIVLGIGAVVMAYTGTYAGPATRGRLLGMLTLFAAAMVGLVAAADVLTLLVFWEATSIISFLLIGMDGTTGVAGARRALLVTGAGGLALLAGMVLAGVATGSFDLAEILAAEPDGATWTIVAVLVALGAFAKSAQVPFGFWLRGAMVAPTPVSTYLHAATMVKAGIFLLLRMSPVLGEVALWQPLLVSVGLATAVVGGVQALRADDLKAILAGSTVSQLGFIVATIGLGHPAALAAAVLHTIAHALFKAPLFMAAGIVDHGAHVRRLSGLGGLWRAMPGTAVVTGAASLSMAGILPFLGFVSKEEVLAASADTATVVLVGIAAASVLTVAYTWRFAVGIFLGGRPAGLDAQDPPAGLLVPTAAAVVGGLVLGLVPARLDAWLDGVVLAVAPGSDHAVHLAAWHGLTPELTISAVVVVLGLLLGRWALPRPAREPGRGDGAGLFDRLHTAVIRIGAHAGRPFVRHSVRGQLAWVLVATGTAVAFALAVVPAGPAPVATLGEWAVLVLLLPVAVVAVTVHTRLAVTGALGAAGLAIVVLWILRGAPDLALTQFSVEALTIVIFLAVFRRLSLRFDPIPRLRGLVTGAVAVVAGGAATLLVLRTLGPRPLSPTGRYYLERAYEESGGHNVVNTILVDFRALDTLGEVTVLAVAALGIAAIVARPWNRHEEEGA